LTIIEQQSAASLFEQIGEVRFELIPAKNIIERAVYSLPSHATLTITCSPTKGIDTTIDMAITMAKNFTRVVPHIAARMVKSKNHLTDVLHTLKSYHLDEIFVVGGDYQNPLGPYHNGYDLLKAISKQDHHLRHIGIPAYPEGHPNVDQHTLDQDLMKKSAFATYTVTQMCFDFEQIFSWLKNQRDAGLTLPVYLGIPGPVRIDKLLRVASRIGVTDSLRFLRKNLRLSGKLLRGYDALTLLTNYTAHLNDINNNVSGLHAYTFNELDTIKKKWAF